MRNRTEYHAAWIQLLMYLRPFAFTVVQFNNTLNTDNRGAGGRLRAIDKAASAISELAFLLDRAFFEEFFVQHKVSVDDRFNAIVIFEKAGSSTHANILWYLPTFKVDARDAVLREFAARRFSMQSKREFILRNLNNSASELHERDSEILRRSKFHQFNVPDKKLETRIKPWSVHTQSIGSTEHDLWNVCRYLSKESAFNRDFSDLVFDLRSFHKGDQRIEPSRCWTFDDDSKMRAILDLSRDQSSKSNSSKHLKMR